MTPAVLRCESRLPRRTGGFGLWRYSLAMMIVLAAILDAVWWVPSHESKREPAVQTSVSHCPK